MAGVGFSLRALRYDGTYGSLLRQYGIAALISSGPWLMSILTLLVIGVVGRSLALPPAQLERFQVCVTWLFASSLVWTGPWQLMFTRFSADREYLDEGDQILPNLIGALSACAVCSACLSAAAWPLFAGESLALKLCLAGAFIVLCQVWLVVVVLNGLRAYGAVLGCFASGYAMTFGMCMGLSPHGVPGLLAGFAIGQSTLLFSALWVLYRRVPASGELSFDFARRRALRIDLGLIGLAYNLGVWVDKLIFWFSASTSRAVLGPFRASEVYDLPIFLAYLTSVPAMAVFLTRVETDFAEKHAVFYSAVRNGASLLRLEAHSDALTAAARRAISDIVRIQAFVLIGCFALGRQLLHTFGISELHLPLFYIDATGVSLQVVLLAVTSMFFYLDKRREVLLLTGLLLFSNALLTAATLAVGPELYGYGFAIATGISSLCGVLQLDRAFTHLLRDTFLLQPVKPC